MTLIAQKDKIQLYQNQVFVTDNVEGIVPEFLTMLTRGYRFSRYSFERFPFLPYKQMVPLKK